MRGTFIRGAFIQLATALIVPVPNVILFQFNPETMRHSLTPASGAAAPSQAAGNTQADPLAVAGLPGETFGFTLVMDAKEQIIEGTPVTSALAQATGLYSRLAALELLVFPVEEAGGGLLGSLSVSVGAGGLGASAAVSGGVKTSVPRKQVPTLLFVWGAGRIVPVRVTSLTITETLFDGLLNPTHAEAQLELRVLTSEEIGALSGLSKDIAKATYEYTQVFRKAMATANLANAAESIIGMLPV
jgi:hypothetical protein